MNTAAIKPLLRSVESMVCSVPRERWARWQVKRVVRWENLCVLKLAQKIGSRSHFLETITRDDHAIIVVERPKSLVEKPVRVFAES